MDYRVYLLDSNDKITEGRTISASGETDACQRAAEVAQGRSYEVWQGTKRVGTFPARSSQLAED